MTLLRKTQYSRDQIINALCRYGKNNPFVLLNVEDDLVELTKKGFPILENLYKALYQPANRKSLPKFCDDEIELPLTFLSSHPRIKPEDFMDETMMGNNGTPMIFMESYFKMCFNVGSSESIKFLQALSICPNSEVFRTPFIKELISYKWAKTGLAMKFLGLVYFTYLFLLCVYTLYFMGDPFFQAALFTANTVLTIFEIYQMIVTGFYYFTYV